jgi:hypothetical protein
MYNNRMKFGDLFIHQHKGIAMGMAPAPSIANLFVAIYEETHISQFPSSSLRFLRRFIDDGFGIWLRDPDYHRDCLNWTLFQDIVNNMGLRWEFSERSRKVTFMDLNIEISQGKLLTSLYAKPLALHLYIPPSSCHAPGIATGLIFGHLFRVFMLCSRDKDIEHEIYLFFNRLLDRGYSLSKLIPLFLTAELKARQARAKQIQKLLLQSPHNTSASQHESTVDSPTPNTQHSRGTINTGGVDNGVFFHLKYHPANPPASEIQRMWRRHILTPHRATPLYHLRNKDGYQINIRKLTIAYSRAPNLGNLLSCRKLRVNIEEHTDMHTGLLQAAEEPDPHNA